LPLGIIYKVKKPAYHRELYGDFNPVTRKISREERVKEIEGLLSPKDKSFSKR